MEIKIKIRSSVYSLIFGYNTPWFEQAYFFSIAKEYYNNRKEVTFAKMIYHS